MKFVTRIFAVAVLLGVLLFLCACDGGKTGNEETDGTGAVGTLTYTVTVTDEAGMPLSDVMLQLCHNVCVPGVTDETGRAVFSLEAADYKVALITMPEGYAHVSDSETFSFEPGQTEMTITLQKIN